MKRMFSILIIVISRLRDIKINLDKIYEERIYLVIHRHPASYFMY